MNPRDSERTPLVGVITRTKDRPVLLRRAVESVVAQTYSPLEWIIVNDGGPAGPVDELAAAAEARGVRVKVLHHETSLGMEAASNRGIAATDATMLTIHDDDDRWHPEFLARTVAYLHERPRYEGVVTQSIKVTESMSGDDVREIGTQPYNPELQSIQLADVALRNRFPPISFLFTRRAYEECGRYDEELPVLGDWDFNLRFLERFDIGVLPDRLAYYHFRLTLVAAASEYGNTVVQGVDKHREYDALIRNRLLRRDLAEGRIGLGWLVAQGRQHQDAMRELKEASRQGPSPKTRLGAILRRLFG